MRVFISYAKEDNYDLALELADKIDSFPQITCWVDRELKPGDAWARKIQRELKRCDVMVVLISPDVHRDPDGEKGISFVLNELSMALEAKKKIIPIKTHDVERPVEIHSLQYIDFTQNKAKGKKELFDQLKTLQPLFAPKPSPSNSAPSRQTYQSPRPKIQRSMPQESVAKTSATSAQANLVNTPKTVPSTQYGKGVFTDNLTPRGILWDIVILIINLILYPIGVVLIFSGIVVLPTIFFSGIGVLPSDSWIAEYYMYIVGGIGVLFIIGVIIAAFGEFFAKLKTYQK